MLLEFLQMKGYLAYSFGLHELTLPGATLKMKGNSVL